MFQYRSDQLQVKRYVISSIANLVCELSHKLPNDLRLRILGNKEILGKSQICVEPQISAQHLFQKLHFGRSSQKTRRNRYQTFLFLSSFTGFVYFVPNILLRDLGWYPRWGPSAGSRGGTLAWDPGVRPWAGTLGWNLKVGHRGETYYIRQSDIILAYTVEVIDTHSTTSFRSPFLQ